MCFVLHERGCNSLQWPIQLCIRDMYLVFTHWHKQNVHLCVLSGKSVVYMGAKQYWFPNSNKYSSYTWGMAELVVMRLWSNLDQNSKNMTLIYYRWGVNSFSFQSKLFTATLLPTLLYSSRPYMPQKLKTDVAVCREPTNLWSHAPY